MRVEDILYFSPNYKTPYLDLENGEILLKAFVERVEEFYFKPAQKLNNEFEAFSKGVLILTAIDFIGDYFIRTGNSDRIKKFCSGLKSIKKLSKNEIISITKIINDDYRNGLIHEGRIKNMGQFFYGVNQLIVIGDKNTMINPNILLDETRERFYEYVQKIQNSKEEMFRFREKFKQRFENEINALPE
ncbi:hypothetical protein [Tenacibaculum xiamenense]|uniref:hypothetical protein n=1 Tax=Tenacibaculum xiamenense TaxID=1261553 RepID=UPI00389305C7